MQWNRHIDRPKIKSGSPFNGDRFFKIHLPTLWRFNPFTTCEKTTRQTLGRISDFIWRTNSNNLATQIASTWPNIDHMIRTSNHRLVVLNHNQRIAI